MNTILYRIPDCFFPGIRVTKPFHAKVNYKVNNGEVDILEVTISQKCMEYIDNMNGLYWKMRGDIEEAERKKGEVHPVMMQLLSPFIKSTP